MPKYAVIVQATMCVEVNAKDDHQAREKGLEEAHRQAEYPITAVGPVLDAYRLPDDVPHGD